MRYLLLNIFGVLLGTMIGGAAQAQNAPTQSDSSQIYDTETIVITGQYGQQSVRNAVHPIRVIGQDKIYRMGAIDLGDVMTNELNIRLSQDNVLGQSMSLQGLSGENVKILIDGVPVIGRQNGNVDLSQINLLDVVRIEIVEGPLSVNYGTNALAGTINLITAQAQSAEGLKISGNLYGEQQGTANVSLSTSLRHKKHTFRLSGGRNFFDGWHPGEADWPDFSRRVADVSRFQQWKPRTQHFARAKYFVPIRKLKLGLTTAFFDEMIVNRGFPRAPYLETAFDDTYHTRRWDQSLSLNGKLSEDWGLQLVAAYNHFERTSNSYVKDLTTLEQSLIQNASEQDTAQFQLLMSRASFTRKNARSWLSYELGYDINYETAFGKRIENLTQVQADLALYSTAEIKPSHWLTVRPGLRYAYNTAYQAPLIPSLNMKINWGDWALRASYARGFRAPSLKELYFYFVDINHNIIGNPDLKAEYSHNYTANLRYQKLSARAHLWKTELGFFYNDMQNLITLAEVNSPVFSYVNIGSFKTTGLNLRLSWQYESWHVQIGGAYVGRYNRLQETETSLPTFSYYPEANGSLQYSLARTKTNFSLFYKFQGRLPGFRLNTDGSVGEQFIEAYSLLDFTMTQPLANDRIQLSLGAKNLLNITNINALLAGGAHSGNGSNVAVSTGRNIFARLSFQLDKK
ncbi:MAG: TonB-dependent receptor [Bacteroidota bacterium]